MSDPSVTPVRLDTSRNPLIVDGAIAAGLALFFLVGTYFASRDQTTPHEPFDVWAALIVVLAAGALTWRRRHPVAVLVAVFAIVLVYFLLDYPNGPIWLALLIAYFTAIVRGHLVPAAIVAVLGFLVFPWINHLILGRAAPSFIGLAALAAWLLVLFGAALAVRTRRERAAEAIRIREGEARRRASEERLRIAQELHDALGHHLSLISVQAGVALHVNEDLPDQVRGSLTAIKQASKEGLDELRSVLQILRQEGDRAPRSPTSTLARVSDLVSQAAAAGLDVHLETRGDERPLPFGVDVAAYRIVQEALTNVSRHAGGSTATVGIEYADGDLVVEVDDDGEGATPPRTQGSGKGLVGMRERVAALGGDLDAGPRPEGGFRVRARLPLEDRR